MNILLPPKIYLDTNHLVEIARARNSSSVSAHSSIDGYLRKGCFGIIFNPVAAMEWVDGAATERSAKEIAAVVDSMPLQYEIERDSFVFLYEIIKELRRLEPNIRLPDFEILLIRNLDRVPARAFPILKNMGGIFDESELAHPGVTYANEIPFFTAAEHVDWAFRFKTERPGVYNERVEGHKAAYLYDLKALSARLAKSLNPVDKIDWMKRFVRVDRVIATLNPGIPVDELLARVDITRCPAVNLFLAAHLHRVKAGARARDNDVDDWMIVHIVPYADVVLTERNLTHFIRQADPALRERVTHDPEKAMEILRPWIES
jgi:hypothetical protein